MATNSQVKTIKRERQDDHEINQLALELQEANRKKMVAKASELRSQNTISQQALQRAGGQQLINFYLHKEKDVGSDSLLPKKTEERKTGTIDEDSARGKFGWTTFGNNNHIPYLMRFEDKYCSVRMVETKLIKKYLVQLPGELFNCFLVQSLFATEIESKLLNEINLRHCDGLFGRESFTTKDLLVRLTDIQNLYRFLETCYKKLVQKSLEQCDYCGFVRINGESVVPYTVKIKVKYVPLFYFEGETDTLKLKSEQIEGWELAFLKFCCKVQGIRNELFASKTCSVVSLEDVKQYFPKDTRFEDWWPQKTADAMRLTSQPVNRPLGSWTQKPLMSPTAVNNNLSTTPLIPPSSPSKPVIAPRFPSVTSTNTAAAAAMKAATQAQAGPPIPALTAGLSNITLYNQWLTSQQLLAAAYNNYPGLMQTLPDMRRGSSHAANAALLQSIAPSAPNSRLPAHVRSNTSQSPYQSSSSRGGSANLSALQQLGYMSEQGLAVTMAANMLNSRHSNANSVLGNGNKSLMKAPPALIPVANGNRDNVSLHNGVTRNGIEKQKLRDVPQYRPDLARQGPAYKVRKISIDNTLMLCINLSSHNLNDQRMIRVEDLVKSVVPSTTIPECTEVLHNVLQISVYRANWEQVKALMEASGKGIDQSCAAEIVPLVGVSDVTKHLTQIKYIFGRNHDTVSHKRAKNL